jgi:talin
MVTNVTSLLKTVKTVEDEAARGTRALESSIEAIQQEIKAYKSTDHVEKAISAEELIRFTKPITIATAKAVAAGNSGRQEDVIVAANMGRKAISDLLKACKVIIFFTTLDFRILILLGLFQAAAAGSDNAELKRRVVEVGASCSLAYRDLLDHINLVIQSPSPENKQRMAQLSKQVASNVSEIVQAAEALKGETADFFSRSNVTARLFPLDCDLTFC